MSNWHGFEIAGRELRIGELPGRKRVALYTISTNGEIDVLAWFTSTGAAGIVLDTLDTWIDTMEHRYTGSIRMW